MHTSTAIIIGCYYICNRMVLSAILDKTFTSMFFKEHQNIKVSKYLVHTRFEVSSGCSTKTCFINTLETSKTNMAKH